MTNRFVRVECRLATPLAGPQAPYLDSLLELSMARHAKSIQESSNGSRHAYEIADRGQAIALDAVGKLPIPIARVHVNGLPIPCCSSPVVGCVSSEHAAHYTSAFPLDKAEHLHESDRSQLRQGGGRFKSFRLPLRMRLIDRIVWFAALRPMPSVASEVRKLLKVFHHIGKKTSQGHGVVAEWIVERIDADYSWYAESEAGPVLMRPLPAEMEHPSGLLGARRSFGGCVGPYWQRDFWTEIVEPC